MVELRDPLPRQPAGGRKAHGLAPSMAVQLSEAGVQRAHLLLVLQAPPLAGQLPLHITNSAHHPLRLVTMQLLNMPVSLRDMVHPIQQPERRLQLLPYLASHIASVPVSKLGCALQLGHRLRKVHGQQAFLPRHRWARRRPSASQRAHR
eukprot:CAMPEP_0204312142 /NCGR_PEP_ID=MMETSP0469-20131031/2797_1 /ASSEMBLY_ACC=CAM_ASM_000384 /TAXON_ID=2969 /ORGANISM="Oxyrrhis marina" /LENGTH=148 /DNA_ID=CAMNT_0051292235 /DNA_START=54 /DNA_END=496 /DNA_ORIENTATION=+